MKKFFIHKTAIIDSLVKIGEGSKIWAFSHISEGVKIGNNCITVCCGKNAIEITNLRGEHSKENIVSEMKFGKKFE